MEKNHLNKNSQKLKISELCEKSGLNRTTIRYYLQSGLLHMPEKSGKRFASLYDETHLLKLKRIRHLKEDKGLPLSKIREILNKTSPDPNNENRHHQEKRKQIIEKAIELFSKNGFARTKINDVAEAVGLGKATFYFYFKSKEKLFKDCVQHMIEFVEPKDFLDNIHSEDEFIIERQNMLVRYLKSSSKYSGILSSLKIALAGNNPKMKKLARDAFKIFYRPLINSIRLASQKKLICEIDEVLLAYCMASVGEGLGYALKMNALYTFEDAADVGRIIFSEGIRSYNTKIAGRDSSGPTCFDVTDSEGLTTRISDVTFEGKKYLVANHGQAMLNINLDSIFSINIQKTDPHTSPVTLLTTVNTGELLTLKADGTQSLTGITESREFSLPINKMLRLLKVVSNTSYL